MVFIKRFIVLYTVAFIFATVKGKTAAPFDENCLICLCEASTNCDVNKGCEIAADGNYYCGPFYISKAYWADAGKPSGNTAGRKAFETCTTDYQCSAITVRNYMTRYAKDCDGDGIIGCADYARIHRLGGYGCKKKSFINTGYYKRYENCIVKSLSDVFG